METNNKQIALIDYILNDKVPFSKQEYDQIKKDSAEFLISPLKVIALLIAISGLFAMVFEVSHSKDHAFYIYLTRLVATLVAFIILVFLNFPIGKKNPVILVHILLLTIIISSGIMIFMMPQTLFINTQIVGLMIFTSALFLSWEVKNQIIVAIYYNIVFASAIIISKAHIYFLANIVEAISFVSFLSIISIIGSAVNFKLRLQLAEKSFHVQLSEQKFRSIFDNSLEGKFQSSIEGKFLTVNTSMAKILGYDTKEELTDLNIKVDLYRYQKDRENLIMLLRERGFVEDYPVTLKKKNGKYVVISLNARIVFDSHDESKVYIEGNIRDITMQVYADEKRKKAEEALRYEKERSDKLAAAAMQSSVAKTQFLANMSHEIRTPMNGILGYLTLIEKETYEDADEMKQFIASAKHSAESLLDIINNILDLSKIESGKMELHNEDFDLTSVINEAVDILKTKIEEKKLTIRKVIKEGTPTLLNGDSARLRQILVNLLSNSVKFTQEGIIKIYFSASSMQENNLILNCYVEDTGIGINSKNLRDLFKPFSQIDSSHTRKFGGTGLGLAICKEFINMMGGTIWVESVEGEGSKFNFTIKVQLQANPDNFKAQVAQNEEVAVAQGPDIIAARQKFRLLLAEDNIVNQKLISRILKEAGYNSFTVSNGNEAVEEIKTRKYNLVLMDCQMPEKDGYTATSEIRELNIEGISDKLPIIAITAHALSGDKEKCLTAGMNDYVAKPILPDQLISKIDKWLKLNTKNTRPKISPMIEQPKLFDTDHLDKMSLGNKEFRAELIQTYLQDLSKRKIKLDDFIKERLFEKVAKEAHTLKGASFSVGATKLGELAFAIEKAAKNDDFAEVVNFRNQFVKNIELTRNFLATISDN
ncbi:MAG: ATP-binding protein [Bacteroidota bacterium]|nr:ATP-binding protein [Bacteroidota bacterium]